ncbi:uncharacterized protein RCH25_009300 [Pelodytes ibericus]
MLGKGTWVTLREVPGSTVCPVSCFDQFCSVQPVGSLSLLVHADSSSLSRFQFIQVFRLAVEALGLPGSEFGGHSFRIGAASEAARLDAAARRVWLIGHSYIFWAKSRAAARPGGENLGLSRTVAEVRWFGIRGMRWVRLLPELVQLSRLLGAPDILLLHLGGNDLGSVPVWNLCETVKRDLASLLVLFPNVTLVWSEVVPRNYWRCAHNQRALERCRVKFNKQISKFVLGVGGVTIRHRVFETDAAMYFRSDGVHLTEVGLDLFNLALQDGLEQAIASVVGSPR